VAGVAALLVSKLLKLSERVGDRARDKDALDGFRLLRATDTADLAAAFERLLRDARAAAVTEEALGHLRTHFGRTDAPGNDSLARAVAGIEDEATLRASITALANDLLGAMRAARKEKSPGRKR
jgi:hypothetical protein